MKKNICILSFSNITRDARVLRQIEFLSPIYNLTVIGYGQPHPDWISNKNITWINVPEPTSNVRTKLSGLLLLLYSKILNLSYDNYYWRKSTKRSDVLEHALASRCDAYLANDWDTLPIAASAARRLKAKLVFDAHEYGPLQFDNRPLWEFLIASMIRSVIHQHSTQIDASMTVAPMIAEKYRQVFNLNPIVVMNAPQEIPLPPKELDPSDIRLVHHGGAINDRRLETMIFALAKCDNRYSLHFMLIDSDKKYFQYLKTISEEVTPGRVQFYEPVPTKEVTKKISEFDVGFYILKPVNYNQLAALPNKLFDFIAAGLAVCTGPSPSMAELINRYNFGIVSPTFEPEGVAKSLNQIQADQWREMQNAAKEAIKHINAETEMGKVIKIFGEVLI
jgi:glycosyltransferase involved in cell wall biosynthesis